MLLLLILNALSFKSAIYHIILEEKITSSTIGIIWQQGQTFKTMNLFIQIFIIFSCFNMIVL